MTLAIHLSYESHILVFVWHTLILVITYDLVQQHLLATGFGDIGYIRQHLMQKVSCSLHPEFSLRTKKWYHLHFPRFTEFTHKAIGVYSTNLKDLVKDFMTFMKAFKSSTPHLMCIFPKSAHNAHL